MKAYYFKNLPTISKPRGRVGKHGNITHSYGGYREFQEFLSARLMAVNFTIPDEFFCMPAIFYIGKKRGHPNDLDDLLGAVQDTLVKYNFIKDDSWKQLPAIYSEALPARESALLLLVCERVEDLITYLQKREKIVKKYTP